MFQVLPSVESDHTNFTTELFMLFLRFTTYWQYGNIDRMKLKILQFNRIFIPVLNGAKIIKINQET